MEEDLQKHRLEPFDLPEGIYFSREFFEHASADDVREAVQDIENQYKKNSCKYVFTMLEKGYLRVITTNVGQLGN